MADIASLLSLLVEARISPLNSSLHLIVLLPVSERDMRSQFVTESILRVAGADLAPT